MPFACRAATIFSAWLGGTTIERALTAELAFYQEAFQISPGSFNG
ncbi:MAG: hypothetical protein AAFY11_01695 [Cyanobacteria bacterium J06641_5]